LGLDRFGVVAFLTAQEGVEEVELTEPWQAVLDAGATAGR